MLLLVSRRRDGIVGFVVHDGVGSDEETWVSFERKGEGLLEFANET